MVFKRLRENWIYWRYRNVTRRWLILKTRAQSARRSGARNNAARTRGTAMYPPRRAGSGRGLGFLALLAAGLAVLNAALGFGAALNLIDLVIAVAGSYAYMRYARL